MTKAKSDIPIYIAGLPRSGTTWIASILNTAKGVKYFHEPFNKDHVPEAEPHWNRYLRAEDQDPEFATFCSQVFSGQIHRHAITHKLSFPYKILGRNLAWLPGRTMIKDVHSCLSLDWIDRHIAPKIVIVVRHPCGIASSWLRTFKPTVEKGNIKGLQRLLSQPQLIEDYLQPFETLLQSGQGFWQNLALYWGVTYLVLHKQKQFHPNWIVVKHEDICRDPVEEYRKLFTQLDLRWTSETDKLLQASTTKDSGKPYSPSRVSSQEPDKWKKELESYQIELIQEIAESFEVPYYSAP